MLNYEFPPIGGGAGNAHLQLLKQYAGNSQLNIDVLTSAPQPGIFTEQFSANINICKVGIHKKQLHYWRRTEVIEWLVKAERQYRRMIAAAGYDLAHAFFGFPTGYLCRRAAKTLPYIISLRGSDVPGANVRLKLDYKILAPLFKDIWRSADKLIACSEGLKERALKFLPEAQIEVIPNGVDLERFRPAEKSRDGSDAFRLVTVGRLSATKRIEILIEAVEVLLKLKKHVRLRIVGGGSQQVRLRKIIAEKNLADAVEMTGRLDSDDMPQVYRNSDIYISATMQEGMSNAMLEAMASGLPIVTTECEGLTELVANNGIIVEKADGHSLAEAVRTLMDNKSVYERMRAAARQRAKEFSWEHVGRQYVHCYKQVAGSDSQDRTLDRPTGL